MSFAIFETGGKQYKASASKIIEIEKLDAEIGKTIQFKNVLLLNDSKTTEVGSPKIDGAIVEAKLLDNVKEKQNPAHIIPEMCNKVWKRGGVSSRDINKCPVELNKCGFRHNGKFWEKK